MTTSRTPPAPNPRRLRSRLAAILLTTALLGGTATVGAAVWHDIELHSSTEAAP